MKGRELLEKMDMVSPVYVEEADRIPIIRVKRWPKVAVAAACLCLVAWGTWGLSGGFGREPGIVAGPGASDAPEVSETPEVSIPPSEPPAPDDSEAMAAYRDVLTGDAGFTHVNASGESLSLDITGIKGVYNPELPENVPITMDFAVLDLDGDGGREVVVELGRDSALVAYEILHHQDGAVYGFLCYIRGFNELRADGTFSSSDGAASYGFGRLAFTDSGYYTVENSTYCDYKGPSWGENMYYVVDHQPATQAEFDAAVSEFYDKEAPVWYELTEENIAAVFTAGEPSDIASIAPEPCPDTLGFANCVVCLKREPELTHWWYYTCEDGEYRLIAYTFGTGDEPDVYRADLDGDGIDELVCNAEWADGAREVLVYRSRDGVIEQGRIDNQYWQENGLEAAGYSIYDPEQGFIVMANDLKDSGWTVTLQGLEHFVFETFEIQAGDPLFPRPDAPASAG